MEPRLKTSTKWTPFPEELLKQIHEVVEVSFADYDIGTGRFTVEGAIYPTEILLRIGFNRPSQLRQDNFEVSLKYDPEKEKGLDQIFLMVDFLGQTWMNFLEDEPESEDLPRQWSPNVFEKRPIFLRYTSVNTNLEKQADELLNQGGKQLIYGKDTDPESHADLH